MSVKRNVNVGLVVRPDRATTERTGYANGCDPGSDTGRVGRVGIDVIVRDRVSHYFGLDLT
jgi:hypothetical protein